MGSVALGLGVEQKRERGRLEEAPERGGEDFLPTTDRHEK